MNSASRAARWAMVPVAFTALLGLTAMVMAALPPVTGSLFSDPLGNGCPSETNLGQYGRSTVYDRTIRIEGSPEMVSRTVTALNRIRDTEWYRYAKALRRIVERNRGPSDAVAWIVPGTAVAYVLPSAVNEVCTHVASTLIHEGYHEMGQGEYAARKLQARALRSLGEPGLAAGWDELAEQVRGQ